MRLGTIVTGNAARAAQARREHPDAVVEGSTEAVWTRAEEHDFVVVATTNDSHVALASRSIDAGIAVVVDKPLAVSANAARELVDRAEARGVPLTVFHNRRWDSDFLTLRRLIDGGELGEVHRFESRFERWRPQAPRDAWRFAATREQGGGVLLDLGTHLVDQALVLFGPAAAVNGDAHYRRGGRAEDDVFIAIRHESGVISHLWGSEMVASLGPRMRVLGSEAALLVEGLDGQEDALRAGQRPDGDWGAEPEERRARLVRGGDSAAVRFERGAWPEFYRRLSDWLHGTGAPPVEPQDSVEVLEVLERIS